MNSGTIVIDRNGVFAVCIQANTCTDDCSDCQLSYMEFCSDCGKDITYDGHFMDKGKMICDDCAPIEWHYEGFSEPEPETIYVDCNCDGGYTGPFGNTCPRCLGDLQYEVPNPNHR